MPKGYLLGDFTLAIGLLCTSGLSSAQVMAPVTVQSPLNPIANQTTEETSGYYIGIGVWGSRIMPFVTSGSELDDRNNLYRFVAQLINEIPYDNLEEAQIAAVRVGEFLRSDAFATIRRDYGDFYNSNQLLTFRQLFTDLLDEDSPNRPTYEIEIQTPSGFIQKGWDYLSLPSPLEASRLLKRVFRIAKTGLLNLNGNEEVVPLDRIERQ